MIYPCGKSCIADSIYDNNDVEKKFAYPAENIRIKITKLDEEWIKKGNVICDFNHPCKVTQVFEANLRLLELPKNDQGEEKIFSKGYKAVMHIHTMMVECEVEDVLYELDKKSKKKIKKPILKKYNDGAVRIRTVEPIACEKIEDNITMGRFTLRDENKTLAIGKIMKVKP